MIEFESTISLKKKCYSSFKGTSPLSKSTKISSNNFPFKTKINFEENILKSPNTKKMKDSLIYRIDLGESENLKKTMRHLQKQTFFKKETIKFGVVPACRDGHTANIYNEKMIVFGGDSNKFPFNDLHSFTIQ